MKKRDADKIVRLALREDLGKGDITTNNLFIKDRKVEAYLLAKQDMILAGSWVFEEVFKKVGGGLKIKWIKKEGTKVKKNTKLCRIEGSLKNLLKGERVALNFIQRLSGIATYTNEFIKKTKNMRAKIMDTRKTTPGLRMLEKYATKVGGAKNHRMGLYDSILIKDNHIAPFGSVKKTLKAISRKKRLKSIEIETRNLKEVGEAVKAGVGIIMLDNMNTKTIKKAVKLINGRAKTEVSGGVTLKTAGKFARCGVDYISVGALTHSPKSADISLKVSF